MLLRQQLRIVERKQAWGPQIPRWQKVPLAALAVRMKDKASNAREALAESVRLFKPDPCSAGIGPSYAASGPSSKGENPDVHPSTANRKHGFSKWRATTRP
jgi:hypothetical protein